MPSFLVDECVPRAVHEALARAGHKVILVRDTIKGGTDEDVVRFAGGAGHVVLTEDRRFGFIAMGMGAPAGVVVLLMGEAPPAEKAARLISVLPGLLGSLAHAITVIGPTSVRRRPV